MSQFETDRALLHPIMTECRVKKSRMEMDVLRYACKISSIAHMDVMRTIKPGMKEYQVL